MGQLSVAEKPGFGDPHHPAEVTGSRFRAGVAVGPHRWNVLLRAVKRAGGAVLSDRGASWVWPGHFSSQHLWTFERFLEMVDEQVARSYFDLVSDTATASLVAPGVP